MSLVVIEGLSGVGKTTLAPRLAAELNADFIPSIPPEFAATRIAIDAQRNVETRHLFYLTALAATSSIIRPRIEDGENILLESYFDRAQAFHLAMGSAVSINVSFFVQPDLVIVLECEEEVRLQRLRERTSSRLSYWHHQTERSVERIRAYYDTLAAAEHLDSSTALEPLLKASTKLAKGRISV